MWRFDTDILIYLPKWFWRIVDYQELCRTESEKFEALAEEVNQVADNFFFQTMEEEAVKMWEDIFNIVPNPTVETLDFRRKRVLNRISTKPPFTLGFLYQKLDELIGKGKWRVTVDYPNYTLYIESSAENQQWAGEVSYTIGKIKPAHIVFVSKPYVVTGITLDESVNLATVVWHYELGAWELGVNPFASTQIKEVVVVPEANSIQETLLNQTAAGILNTVAKARVNGSIVIDSLTKMSEGNAAVIQYSVAPGQAETVTQIELLDEEGNVLTMSPVYVPLTEAAVFTHNIPVEEA